ncbi:hypothetical protein EON80_19870 [bacterium]|nr:MAG: hypothetical protein EON80_19870 [bacterium]
MRLLTRLSTIAALASLLLSGAPCHAQIVAGEIGAKLVPYSRAIPKSASRLMPRGAKSLFWGQFTPKKGSAVMAVHIYAPRKKFKSEDEYHKLFTHYLRVDIFRKGRAGFVRVHHLALADQEWDDSYPSKYTAKVHFLWLNSHTQDTPVIAFDYFDDASFPNGGTTFIVFDSKWQHHSVAGEFGYSWTGGAGSQGGYEASRSPEGELQFRTSESSFEASSSKVYRYDGQKFVVIPELSIYQPREP